MKEQDFTPNNLTDAEYEKWIEKQLKLSMVEPPLNFTDAVMERVEKPIIAQQNDPTILFIAMGIMIIGGFAVTVPTIFPEIWGNLLQHLNLNFWSNPSSTIHVVSSMALLCVIFFGFDWLLSKRFKGGKISIA